MKDGWMMMMREISRNGSFMIAFRVSPPPLLLPFSGFSFWGGKPHLHREQVGRGRYLRELVLDEWEMSKTLGGNQVEIIASRSYQALLSNRYRIIVLAVLLTNNYISLAR